jgi:flagellar protein FliO/FliZ
MSALDLAKLIEAAGALAAVLGLLVVLAVGLRWWRARTGGIPSRRLAVVETLALDGRHRLVRVRDADREHLLLVGAATPVVLDTATAPGGEPT